MSAPTLTEHTTDCLHPGCNAGPKFSVSEHIGQDTDYRSCGRHLTWLIQQMLRVHGPQPFVVATRTRR